MNYLIFIILILTLIIMYFYYDYKLALVRKQLMIASKQYTNIRYKQSSRNRKFNTNFSITFSSPISKAGLLNSNSNIYLAPLKTAPTLRKTTFSMEVQILDCANSEDNIWYYINLPLDTNINCRGWVSVSDFSILYSEISNLSKSR